MNTYNFPTFGTVALVILVFVGVGLLAYYAYDVTQNYYELLDDMTALQDQVNTLKNEKETLTKMNADLINRNNGLDADNKNLSAANANLTAELQACRLQAQMTSSAALQSAVIPSDPRALIILIVLAAAAALTGTLSFRHFRSSLRRPAVSFDQTSTIRCYRSNNQGVDLRFVDRK
jgi:FtsZ-binding cell division protein ZapB